MRMIALFVLAALLYSTPSFSFSEYGAYCESNDDCLECRDSTTCIICIHNCENKYGTADGPLIRFGDRKRNPKRFKKACSLMLSKWCNAQCWDKDDPMEPSTKPNCNVNVVGERRDSGRIYWSPLRDEE
jgi:hypothetical protein